MAATPRTNALLDTIAIGTIGKEKLPAEPAFRLLLDAFKAMTEHAQALEVELANRPDVK